MKRKHFYIIFIIFLISIFYVEINQNVGKPRFYKNFINKVIPGTLRQKVKEVLFNRSYKIEKLQYDLNVSENRASKFEEQINLKNKKIHKLLNEYKQFIEFTVIEEDKKLSQGNYELKLKKFITSDLLVGKNITKFPRSTAYIHYYESNLFIVSGDGIISYEKLDNFIEQKNVKAKIIKSNILKMIKDPSFQEHSFIGVKDINIIDGLIYLSYSSKIKDNCRNTSIIRGKLNYEKIYFEKFFSPKECVTDGGEFGIKGYWSTGGRIVNKDKDSIYFTHGTYGNEPLAQNKNSILGKILEINKKNQNYNLVSIGHRNPQGLTKDENFLIETEHGPSGGDEINIINTSDPEVKNYGWPISSYGEHVGWDRDEKKRKKFYKLAPLHKSHEKYGFIEPSKTCVPSCAISQIVKLSDNFLSKGSKAIAFGTLGSSGDNLRNSLNIYEFDNNYKNIVKETNIVLNKRVRDMIFVEERQTLVLYLEDIGEIALINKIN